jgi:hypothetical protein
MVASLSLQASPFSDDFVDVAELNAHVSDRMLARIATVRSAAPSGDRVPSSAMTVLGPAGGGKTHLLGRVRQIAGPNATLVLLRPYFGVSISLRDVLAAIIDQLCRRPKGTSLSQIDLVIAYWLASDKSDKGSLFPSASALETRELAPEARTARLEQAVARVVDRMPELAPVAHLVRAFLGIGSLERAELWAELAWLSGREPRSQADGAVGVLGEGDILHVLSIAAILAAPVAPLALIFDQLENLATEGEERVLGYGNLISELVDSVPCLTIVQLALTSEWLQFIEPRLSLSQRTRVANDKLVLELPTEKERRLLLRAWQARLAPPTSTKGRKKRAEGPLSEAQMNELLTAPGVTPRILGAAYSRALAGKPMWESDVERNAYPRVARPMLTELFETERARVESELDEKERANLPIDAGELAEGLAAALAYVPQLELETRSERERILTVVRAPGSELTILYLTSSHHASVAAGLARASELARSGKVAIVREKRFDFPASWATVDERRAAFERLPNARWLWLDRDEAARCLTLARLSSLARAKRLRSPGSDEALSLEWVRVSATEELVPSEWSGVLSVARWLSDVPREGRPTSPEETAPRSRRDVPASAVDAPPLRVGAIRSNPSASGQPWGAASGRRRSCTTSRSLAGDARRRWSAADPRASGRREDGFLFARLRWSIGERITVRRTPGR